jgi:molybdenum ABC transporter ATP-binding protein
MWLGRAVNKLICAVLIACAVGGAAKAADLPMAKSADAQPSKPSCFSSVWEYFKSSVRDCPLRYGPFTVYGNIDAGFGYEQWGAPLGTNADKPNYAIQRSSGNTHWLLSPNALSTSTIGIRFSEEVAKDWEILGVAEAGYNPYTMRLVNGPQSLANNNLKKHDGPTIDFDEVVELLGIGALLDRSPRNLSGGERQRVGIGRALLAQPKVLLMDELLSALDRRTKGEILPFIEKLRDHFALPIFYVTHDTTEVERLADQMVLLDKGHVVAVGPLAELQADPNSMLATSPEAAVSLRGVIEGSDARFGLLRVSLPGGHILVPSTSGAVGDQIRVRILATGVSLAPEPPGRSSILNVLPAQIIATNALNAYEVLAAVALGEDGAGARLLARVPQKSWENLRFARGQNVFAQVKSVALDRAAVPE